MNFYQWLYEDMALPLSTAKKYTAKKSQSRAYTDHKVEAVFQGKHRIVIPFTLDELHEDDSLAYPTIKKFLYNHGLSVNWLSYLDGKAVDGRGQQIRIGKILEKHDSVDLAPWNREDVDKPHLHIFKNDPVRLIKRGEYAVVVSRHPYDIAGMSTDRSWTSCMDIGTARIHNPRKEVKKGVAAYRIPAFIREGGLVMYLIPKKELRENGKTALRKPLLRIALAPYVNENNDLAYGIGTSYPCSIHAFELFAEEWVMDNLNISTTGEYTLAKGVYDDSYATSGFDTKHGTGEEFINHLQNYFKKTNRSIYFFDPEQVDLLGKTPTMTLTVALNPNKKITTEYIKQRGLFYDQYVSVMEINNEKHYMVIEVDISYLYNSFQANVLTSKDLWSVLNGLLPTKI
jgi:hypothetical protein